MGWSERRWNELKGKRTMAYAVLRVTWETTHEVEVPEGVDLQDLDPGDYMTDDITSATAEPLDFELVRDGRS